MKKIIIEEFLSNPDEKICDLSTPELQQLCTMLNAEIERILDVEKSDPEYTALHEKLKEVRRRYYASIDGRVDALRALSNRAKLHIQHKKDQQRDLLLSHLPKEDVQRLTTLIFRMNGVYASSPTKRLRIVWVDDIGRYVIITNPGGTFRSGIGDFPYGEATHYLLDTSTADVNSGKYFQPNFLANVSGRLTNEKKNYLISLTNKESANIGASKK